MSFVIASDRWQPNKVACKVYQARGVCALCLTLSLYYTPRTVRGWQKGFLIILFLLILWLIVITILFHTF